MSACEPPASRRTLPRRLPFALLPLLALPAVWPLSRIGLPSTADGALHLLRVALLDHHAESGHALSASDARAGASLRLSVA